jgi:hypothetical protein
MQKIQSDMAPTTYTILFLLNATPKWLQLTRDERSSFVQKELTPIIQRVVKTVKVSFYDSEYFHSSISDFMIINTSNLWDYQFLIELLRDTKIYGVPYFEVKDLIVGQENLFENFNEKIKIEKQ